MIIFLKVCARILRLLVLLSLLVWTLLDQDLCPVCLFCLEIPGQLVPELLPVLVVQ
jgi:hypothetical protein